MNAKHLKKLFHRMESNWPWKLGGTWHLHRHPDGDAHWIEPQFSDDGDCALGREVLGYVTVELPPLKELEAAERRFWKERDSGLLPRAVRLLPTQLCERQKGFFGGAPCSGPVETCHIWSGGPRGDRRKKLRMRRVPIRLCSRHAVENEYGLMAYQCTPECRERTQERSPFILDLEDTFTYIPNGSVFSMGVFTFHGRRRGGGKYFQPRCRFCGKEFKP